MIVDNHSLAIGDDCALKWREQIRDGWVSRFPSAALGYGIAVHAGLAVWYKYLKDHGRVAPETIDMALAAIADAYPDDMPVDDFRTLARAKELFLKHCKEYPSESFSVVAVEEKFTLPLGHYLTCANSKPFNEYCGHELRAIHVPSTRPRCPCCERELEPIEYGGIIDLLAQFGSRDTSTLYVVDHKTTSQLGPTFFLQFNPNNQVTGYVWGGGLLSDRPVAGAFINALCTTVSGNMKFERGMTARNAADIDEFKTDVVSKCNRLRSFERTGVWPKSTGHCQNKYGMCSYHGIHVLSHEDERQRRRETDYIVKPWDHEARDG